jgi:hypothetical protein
MPCFVNPTMPGLTFSKNASRSLSQEAKNFFRGGVKGVKRKHLTNHNPRRPRGIISAPIA